MVNFVSFVVEHNVISNSLILGTYRCKPIASTGFFLYLPAKPARGFIDHWLEFAESVLSKLVWIESTYDSGAGS